WLVCLRRRARAHARRGILVAGSGGRPRSHAPCGILLASLRRRPRSLARCGTLLAGPVHGVEFPAGIPGPASGRNGRNGRFVVIVRLQARTGQREFLFITLFSEYLRSRQSVHLRVGQAELQVNTVGSVGSPISPRRWRGLFEGL